MSPLKTAELDAKFATWLAQQHADEGDWHYDEDLFDDIIDFVADECPTLTSEEVMEIAQVYFDESKENYVERGSRYA